MTLEDMEKQLDPCPLCGQPVGVDEVEVSKFYVRTIVRCPGCGLSHEWRQTYACSDVDRIPITPDFVTIWNQRAKT